MFSGGLDNDLKYSSEFHRAYISKEYIISYKTLIPLENCTT